MKKTRKRSQRRGQNSLTAILFTRILGSLQQCRGKSCLKSTSFVGKMQKLNWTLRLPEAHRQWYSLLHDQTTAGIQRCNRGVPVAIDIFKSSFYWLHQLWLVAVPPSVWYNLPAVSALCSSLVSALTDHGAISFNLSVESSPPRLLKGFPFKLLLFHSQSDCLFSRRRSPYILSFNV